MEESVNLDKHKPDPKYAWLSNKSFQSENPIVRVVFFVLILIKGSPCCFRYIRM